MGIGRIVEFSSRICEVMVSITHFCVSITLWLVCSCLPNATFRLLSYVALYSYITSDSL